MKAAIITSIIFLTGLALFLGVVFINVTGIRRNVDSENALFSQVSATPEVSPIATFDTPKETPTLRLTPSPTPISSTISSAINYSVPFTPQAPLAQWSDPVFQDACEEASIIMAVYWAQGKTINSPQEATRLIQAMSDWEQEQYGEFRDRSVIDSVDIVRDYLKYDNVRLQRNITIEDIKAALLDNSVVVVPAAGQELNNPNFSPPGPLNHMLVIRGYDPSTNEFITNEPGTRNGEGFRYNENVLYSAVRDYPTGYHEPITSREKNMMVIKKSGN